MTLTNVLISLHRGYGLGDAVQMSAVLRHVVKAHPDWIIDFQAEEGRHQVGRGIAANTFAYGEPYPSPHYDVEVHMILFDTWYGWNNQPNTRVSSCLHERFSLLWDREYGRYTINISKESSDAVYSLLYGGKDRNGGHRPGPNGAGYVAVHYEGDSSPKKKDLTHDQAARICEEIECLGYTPLILDWKYKSTLAYYRKLRAPSHWGSNAEMVCAVIAQCKSFVGIDSGPGKCASATDVPSLIVWTGHHPATYHDPAPNTTHLVPAGYNSFEPVCGNSGVINWFESNYRIRQYKVDPVEKVREWLSETLR